MHSSLFSWHFMYCFNAYPQTFLNLGQAFLFITPLGLSGGVKSSRSLSFFLEFCVFSWFLGISPRIKETFWNFGIFELNNILFLNILGNKNDKICIFPLKKCNVEFFSWFFFNLRKKTPRAWVYFLSFWLEFCAWVLVFLTTGVKTKSLH